MPGGDIESVIMFRYLRVTVLDYVYRQVLGPAPSYLNRGVAVVNMSINSGKVGFNGSGQGETNRAALMKLVTPSSFWVYEPARVVGCVWITQVRFLCNLRAIVVMFRRHRTTTLSEEETFAPSLVSNRECPLSPIPMLGPITTPPARPMA